MKWSSNMDHIFLFTIGFTKKNAEKFFSILESNKVKTIIDVRLNNTSQLAAFTKQDDLRFFLHRILNCSYVHLAEFAPTEDILSSYKNKKISWNDYERMYLELLEKRKPENKLSFSDLDHACLLCSEPLPEKCHRRLAAEYLKKKIPGIVVRHL